MTKLLKLKLNLKTKNINIKIINTIKIMLSR